MKYILLTCALFLLIFASCDEAKKILNIREAPVIEEIILVPDDGLLYPKDTVYAEVTASNPEDGALTYYWSTEPENAGQFAAARDKAFTRWEAPFSGGEYKLKIEVSNGYKSVEKHRIVKVAEIGDPIVEIVSPVSGAYHVQNQPLEISGNVFHGNGIENISLRINGVLIAKKNTVNNGPFTFSFTPDSSYLGSTAILVEAVAKIVATAGSDRVDISIEGFLPKRPAGF